MTDRDVDLNKIKLRGFPVQNKHGMGNKVPPQRSKEIKSWIQFLEHLNLIQIV